MGVRLTLSTGVGHMQRAGPSVATTSLSTRPDGYDAEERQALPLAEDGNTEEAATIFERWIARDPTFCGAHFQLAFALLAAAHESASQGLTPARRQRKIR